jgi:sugar lactone lactonase YvrE
MHVRGLLALAALLGSGLTMAADNYLQARSRVVQAYREHDYALMVDEAKEALRIRPGFPAALYNLALAQSLDEDPAAAMATLNQLADMQVDLGADAEEDFASLTGLADWPAYLSRLQTLRQPVGQARVELALDQGDFVPEGIAVDNRGRIYLGSVRHGLVLRAAPGQSPETLSRAAGAGHWSVLGMRLDQAGQLWFASAGLPQTRHLPADQPLKSGLFRLNPDTGEITHRALLPEDGRVHVLGDLVIADDGTLYTSDSATGMVYAYKPAEEKFIPLLGEGQLQSPQGLALDSSQRHLYLADYNYGVYRLDLASGQLEAVQAPGTVSLHGVDGLYFAGNSLIAVQNGLRPNRVVQWELDQSGLLISSAHILAMNLPQFDEPTLGTVVGTRVYFVANSHWNRFDRDNMLPDGLTGPIILSVQLSIN